MELICQGIIMVIDYREERLVKCPILVAPERNVRLSERRVLECINCPVMVCFEEIVVGKNQSRLALFLQDVQLTIKELKSIESFIIHEC